MSNYVAFTAALLWCGAPAWLFAAERGPAPEKIEIKPRTTHAEIAKKRKPGNPDQARKEVRLADVSKGESGHRKEREKKGLIARSSVISSGQNWTLVPREAILHVPPSYRKRVNDQRGGKLVGWQDFYARNRSWIRALPVTIEQARGDDPLTEEVLDSLRRAGQVVVAVCKGGPISVRLPAEPERAEAENGKPAQPPPARATVPSGERRAAPAPSLPR